MHIYSREEAEYVHAEDGYGYLLSTEEWGVIVHNEHTDIGLIDLDFELPSASNQLRCVYDTYSDIVYNRQKYSPEVAIYLETIGATKTAYEECRSAVAVDWDFYAINSDLSKFFDPHEPARATQYS